MLKRSVAVLASTAVLSLLVAPAADADGPTELAEYGAGSSATALVLSLLGEELAVSSTAAAVGSTPQAAADGAALLLAGTAVPGAAPASTPGGLAANSVCPIEADLAEITSGALSGLELEIACVETTATVTDGAPAATSGSGEVKIIVRGPGGALLEPILTPLLEGATSLTDPIIVALDPLLGVIEDVTDIDVGQVIDDLIEAVGDDLFVLAEIVVAPTLSRASADSVNGVVAESGSNGVTINLLPGIESTLAELTDLIDIEEPSTGPLLQVRLGTANAQVVRDPVTGAASPDASAAQLLSIGADDSLGILTGITGQLTSAINGLAVDQLSCDGGVLADIVCVDLGSVSELSADELAARYPDFGDGVVGREASAASVAVLPIASEALGIGGDGVLGLSLASADAAAFAVPAQDVPTTTTTAPPSTPQLPRTGADRALPLLLTLGLFAAAATGLATIRRSRTV